MTQLTGLLAMLALTASASFVAAHQAPADDCKEQSATDDDACAPAIAVTETMPLGGLGPEAGIAIAGGALALLALAGGGSGSH